MTSDPTTLDKVFTHRSDTHSYEIKWTSLGNDDLPPLIFIHGTPWSSRVWAPFAVSLRSHFKVYLFDNPGYGESPGRKPLAEVDGKTELDASLSGQADTFAALYKYWGFNESNLPHLVVHDNGGLVSLRANLLHGCRYKSLCLIDVVAVRPFGSPFFRLVAENQNVFNQIPDAIFQGTVRAYVKGASHLPLAPSVEDMLVAPWIEGGTQGQEAFLRQMVQADQRHAEDVEARYDEVGQAMPIKVIWGTEDKWIPVDRAERLGKMIGAKEVVLVEEAGHLIMYDQPVRLATEITMWLLEMSRT